MPYRAPWDARARLFTARTLGSTFSSLFAHAHRVGLLPGPRRVRALEDVPYGRDPRQACDLYLPAGPVSGPLPTMMFVHGGGWIACSRKMSAAWARTLASRGIAVIAPGYRLLPDVTLEQQRADIATALLWLQRAGAERWGLDLTRFVMAGESAGAHLALRAAQAWPSGMPKPRGLVGVYGMYDVSHLEHDQSALFLPVRIALCQGRAFREVAGDHSALRPLSWNDVPVLLLHGEADVISPVHQSHTLAEALSVRGVRVLLRTYPGAGHGFIYDGHPKPRHLAASAYRALYRFLAEVGLLRRGSLTAP